MKMVRKKSFDRTVVKKCPKCEQQIPVACKFCRCGHQFWHKKFPSMSSSSSVEDDGSVFKIRRTERTRRESQRPDYFNSIVVETQSKRGRKKQSQSSTSTVTSPTEPPSTPETPTKKKRGRPKGTPNKPTIEDVEKDSSTPSPVEEEKDIFADLPPERVKQFQYILMDLNRKFTSQNFKPV